MKSPHFAVDFLTSLCYHKNIIDNPEFERRNFYGELVYQALMQSVAAFFFAVMMLPAVVIFLGYLIYIVVMCIRELKKK